MKLTEPSWNHLMYYSSRKLTDVEHNYSTTEREALGMIYIVNEFQHYLLGRKFTFHMDHTALLYLVSKQSLTRKLARWMLPLQEFEFEIHLRPGTQHVVANYLSRIGNGNEAIPRHHDLRPEYCVLRQLGQKKTRISRIGG